MKVDELAVRQRGLLRRAILNQCPDCGTDLEADGQCCACGYCDHCGRGG